MNDNEQDFSPDPNWIVLADGAGLVASVQPEAAELAAIMAGIGPGPEIPANTPVESPGQQPDERPAESPEEHPDSRPQEHPDDAPTEVPPQQP
jgi:hypothetical protein